MSPAMPPADRQRDARLDPPRGSRPPADAGAWTPRSDVDADADPSACGSARRLGSPERWLACKRSFGAALARRGWILLLAVTAAILLLAAVAWLG